MAGTSKAKDNIQDLSDDDEESVDHRDKSKYKDKKDRMGVVNAWNQKIAKFQKGDMKHKLAGVTSFEVNFPEYREDYLKKSFPILKKIMKEQGIAAELDALKGQLRVSTTDDTWDPYAIMLARDVIKLLSRFVPIEKAVQVFDEDTTSEIIVIKNMCRDNETFIKRRNRLQGKDNAVLQALQRITKCTVVVQGGTVAVIGPYKGVMKVMRVVKDCMKNVHPLYLLNALYLKESYSENPDMQNEDWSNRFPDYKPNKQKKNKKKNKIVQRKEYNPMPPLPLESKVDQQIEQGEMFISKHVLKKAKLSKQEQKAKSEKIQTAKRAAQYVAPNEPVSKRQKLDVDKEVDVDKLKKKLKAQKKKKTAAAVSVVTEDTSSKKKKDKKNKADDH